MSHLIDRRDFLAWSGAGAFASSCRPARAEAMPCVLHALGPDDGSTPQGAPVSGPDGVLYGSFMHGGSGGLGQIYRLTLDGVFTERVAMPYSPETSSDIRPDRISPNSAGANFLGNME